jgi:L-rhamnose mutarotase
MEVQRFGRILKLKPEAYEEYKRLHANTWDEVLAGIHDANIRNFSIYHWNGFLFAYMEYIGEDMEADWKKMSEGSRNQKWQEITRAMQEPVDEDSGYWWFPMEELFHTD